MALAPTGKPIKKAACISTEIIFCLICTGCFYIQLRLSMPLVSWSGREDSNLRPLAPHASTLPGCATPRRAANYSRAARFCHMVMTKVLIHLRHATRLRIAVTWWPPRIFNTFSSLRQSVIRHCMRDALGHFAKARKTRRIRGSKTIVHIPARCEC